MMHWRQDKDDWLEASPEDYRHWGPPPSVWQEVRPVLGWVVAAGVGYVLATCGVWG